MTTGNSSEITREFVARKTRVLLLGSYETALLRDAFLYLCNDYQVTATSKATAGLSMIINGGVFDCVLVNSDECDTNLKSFVDLSSKLLPYLKIILMVPDGKQKEMLEIALDYKAVWFCVKPCGLYGISKVFEHIINRKMEFLKKGTDSKSIKRRKYSNFANKIEGWNTRGKEKAYPNAIPEQMNVPRLSRNHIASHPQFQVDIERGRRMKEPVIMLPEKTFQNLHVQDYARQRCGPSTPSHFDASKFQSNSLHRPSNLNSIGSLTMHVDSIRCKLQQISSSGFPVLTAATRGGQAPDHSYIDLLHKAPGETSTGSALGQGENPHRGMAQGSQVELEDQDYRKEIDTMVTGENYSLPDLGKVVAPLDVGATVESQYNLGVDANSVSNVFDNSNSGGASGFPEAIPTLDVGATLGSQFNPEVIANVYLNGFDNSCYSGGASGSRIFEAPATPVVDANVTSQYNLGANGNLFSNAFDNSNSGGASGSGIFEAPGTFVVGENVESQYTLGANANVYSNGFYNSNSGSASGTRISATFVVGANVESQYNLGGYTNIFSNGFDNSNFGGASGSGMSEALPTSVVVANVESQYNLGANANIFSNGFDNSNSGGASGSGLSKELANVDAFGIPIDSHTTATDSVPSPTNGGLEDLAVPEFNSSDLGGDFHPQENVDNSHNIRLPVSAGEEEYSNNSWLNNMIETDSNISMGNYNENYDIFFYGP